MCTVCSLALCCCVWGGSVSEQQLVNRMRHVTIFVRLVHEQVWQPTIFYTAFAPRIHVLFCLLRNYDTLERDKTHAYMQRTPPPRPRAHTHHHRSTSCPRAYTA